ncbi:hypothetical protein [Pontibacter fetidus]|uniref:Uncharacterized protein n=1 Tax=Pontibacter fetidus TaxID=2700082 RepID=A0A6B2H4C4_9BACT|nr:hypothetical protein [Pontibacter fetidus]NDK55476.1 hypothetical protein [Pontibacter fetidus]
MKNKTIVILVVFASVLLLKVQFALAQEVRQITPLHQFFQANYDSTIIYHRWSNWNSQPNYIIVTKYKNQLYFFTYANPYRQAQGISLPGDLHKLYAKEDFKYDQTLPDTNRYLVAHYIKPSILQDYWKELKVKQLWNIKVSKVNTDDICGIDDGDENTFYFISKSVIKRADFYAPSYFAKCYSNDPNLQKAIQTIKLLQELSVLQE